MAVTRLKRKARVNKSRAIVRKDTIKRLSATPIIKKVDIEELKASFAPAKKAAPKKKEAPAEEVKEVEQPAKAAKNEEKENSAE